MLKFSPANAKIQALSKVKGLKAYLQGKKKVYSLDLLSGHSCPGALKCKSKVVVSSEGKKSIQDGPDIEYRCFSASQEVLYSNLYNLRKHNMDTIISLIPSGVSGMADAICKDLPKNAGVIRYGVGGDIMNQIQFDAYIEVAKRRPDILFYFYTKSLNFLVRRLDQLPANFIYTASKGGRYDHFISEYGLREAIVVMSRYEAKKLGLKIDVTDEYAANPDNKLKNFALLLHGPQKAGTKAAKRWQAIKQGEGGYSR